MAQTLTSSKTIVKTKLIAGISLFLGIIFLIINLRQIYHWQIRQRLKNIEGVALSNQEKQQVAHLINQYLAEVQNKQAGLGLHQVQIAFNQLIADGVATPGAQFHTALTAKQPRLVFISLKNQQQPVMVASGLKIGLDKALEQALKGLDFSTINEHSLIKVDIVMSIAPRQHWHSWQQFITFNKVQQPDRYNLANQALITSAHIEPGLTGLIFDSHLQASRHSAITQNYLSTALAKSQANLSYLLPKQLMELGLNDSQGEIELSQFRRLFVRLPNRVRTFTTDSFAFNYQPATDSLSSQTTTQTKQLSKQGTLQKIDNLYRGHKLFANLEPKELTAQQLLSAANNSATYLVNHINDQGKFDYIYQPGLSATTFQINSNEAQYNILRHAGTTYSLLQLYRRRQQLANSNTSNAYPQAANKAKFTPSTQQLLATSHKALSYLLSHIQICQPSNTKQEAQISISKQNFTQMLAHNHQQLMHTQLCVVENDAVKLGGNSLAIIALSEYLSILQQNKKNTLNSTNSTTARVANLDSAQTQFQPAQLSYQQLLAITQGLARWIVNQQNADGSFAVHKLIYSSQEATDFVSGYYPGEATFALIKLYQLDHNPTWLRAAQDSARYIITVRDHEQDLSYINQDHWLLYALPLIYQAQPQWWYWQHALKLTKAIAQIQYAQSPPYPDWRGAIATGTSTTTAATRVEGLTAAYQLANLVQASPQDKELILTTAQKAALFCLQAQYTPLSAMYNPDYQQVLGGSTRSLSNNQIRIDYVHHNLSGWLLLSQIVKRKGALPATKN